ncbi:hypothetical protein [Microcoleus sp. LEGE 07076]
MNRQQEAALTTTNCPLPTTHSPQSTAHSQLPTANFPRFIRGDELKLYPK